ncbi:hypothetical protein [Chitinophaga filiformis]|uniref:Uncharacterized protein n=1 Tax=Chitinophaga filiformis TaxID=104663 RepID=A0ABY4I260_CHIFI|nr:hypothetical protein [Chitinophaga filiformis]UPK69940.1 hypothetical protein MYF79_01380 [Chitinophaga filiformis]
MSSSDNIAPVRINSQNTIAGSKDPNGQIPEIIVIPDECGDSLWDDVLEQHPDLTTIGELAIPESDESPSILNRTQPNQK